MTTEREYREWEAKRNRQTRKKINKSNFSSPSSKPKSKPNSLTRGLSPLLKAYKSLIILLLLGLFFIAFRDNREKLLSWLNQFTVIPESPDLISPEISLDKIISITLNSNQQTSDNSNISNSLINPSIPVKSSTVFNTNYESIDQAAKNTKYYGSSVRELANLLQKHTQTEAEKARIIYTWIAHNISYDVSSFLAGGFSNIKPSDVLEKRLAVCSGYANLYQALAQEMGLESVTINGYSKGIGYIVGNSSELNHGWNAVKIDGNWYLIDVTWGAGHIEDNRFVPQFNPYYFATPPEQFIYDHLPENPKWQLLTNQFTREQFESLPETSAQFFKTGLRMISHNNHTIKANNRVTIRLAAPPNIIATARLSSGMNVMPDNYTFVQQSQGNIIVNASFPTAGTYKLEIFAKERGESGLYPHAISYKIIANSPSNQFPKTYSTLIENNGNLVAPLMYSLPKNSQVYFEVSLDNAVEVQVFNESSNQWTPLNRSGRNFSGYVLVKPGKTQIMARFPGDNNRYWSLAEYQ